MKILYGVTGEGLGHTMRARTLARQLASAGHSVCVAASSRAAPILRSHGLDTIAIDGLRLRYRDGALERVRSIAGIARAAPSALVRNVEIALGPVRAFGPDAVITDFDSFTYVIGRLLELPIISFDHQHVLERCRHSGEVLRSVSSDFRAARAVVRAKTPRCAHFVVSSFFFPPVRATKAASTTLVGPVLRPEIMSARSVPGDHVLVYQTAAGDPRLLPALLANGQVPFRVYGCHEHGRVRNVELCGFDEGRFIADLASARGVIANGGFTTLAEAVYLGKPILGVPIRHQGEQELNAAYLEALGFGTSSRRIHAVVVRRFVERISIPVDAGAPRRVDPRIATGTADACRAIRTALAEAA